MGALEAVGLSEPAMSQENVEVGRSCSTRWAVQHRGSPRYRHVLRCGSYERGGLRNTGLRLCVTLVEGKIQPYQWYLNPEEALEAAGLQE